MKKNFYKLFLLILIISCSSENIFLSFEDTPNGWEYKNPIKFNFSAPDEAINISLILRLDKSYPFSNMFIIYKIVSGENIITDTFELDLMKEKKDIFSNNSLSLYNHNFLIAENISLKASNVSVELSHATRYLDNIKAEEKLTGILSVGLLVERFPDEKL